MNHPCQSIIDQCELAVRSVAPLLKDEQVKDALDDILQNDEWLLGLECVIDWLGEEDIKISPEQFDKFEKAYKMMSLADELRLKSLQRLCKI